MKVTQTLSQIQTLAVQAQSDPDAAALFERQMQITAAAFADLPVKDQALHLNLLKVGAQLDGFYQGHPVPEGEPLEKHQWLLNPHANEREYVRYLGGRGTPFVTYDLTVRQSESDGRWIPMHGSVSMPSQASAAAAANMAMNYWHHVPLQNRITSDQYQSICNQGELYGTFPRLEQLKAERSLSELTLAYNKRLRDALEKASPKVLSAWTAETKKSRVRAALAEPLTDSREQAVRLTFVIRDAWVHVYEPDGKYDSPEWEALADEFRQLLRSDFFETVSPNVAAPQASEAQDSAVQDEQRVIDPLDERDYFPSDTGPGLSM